MGVLPKTPMVVGRSELVLRFGNGFKVLAGGRMFAQSLHATR
jgi:hypothetical protein